MSASSCPPRSGPTRTDQDSARPGWLASIVSVSSASPAGKSARALAPQARAEMIVRFRCDGEDEPVSMAVNAFREHCKSLGMPAPRRVRLRPRPRRAPRTNHRRRPPRRRRSRRSRRTARRRRRPKRRRLRRRRARQRGRRRPPRRAAGVNERFFVPPRSGDEKPTKTAHGKGWLASIVSVSSRPLRAKRKTRLLKPEAEMIVRFRCDGEDEPVSMAVNAFHDTASRWGCTNEGCVVNERMGRSIRRRQ